jgi:LytS/YehU family sensor histidine kinase
LEPQTLSAQVPHLILQPVVENAIQHAIAPRSARGHINIEAKRLDSLLRVAVSDNGPGLTSHAIAPAKKCVGLTNVRNRLQQVYGPDFRFELTNGQNGGLTVVMEIPIRRAAHPEIEQRST